MRSKKRTIGILIVVIVVLLGFAGSLLVYRNKLLSENAKNTSSDNIAQSLSSTSSNGYFENFYDKPITDENIALDSIEVNRTQLGYDDENLSFEFMRKDEYMGASYRFKILYKGIPLNSEEARVLVDENGNARTLISRKIPIKLLEKISTTPKITEDEALNIAKETLGEDFLEYNLSANFKQVKISPELVIYEINDKYFLSYYIQSGSYICIVDAESGDVITANSTEMSNTAEFEGQNGDIHQVFYDDYKDENYDIKNALWNSDKGLFIFDNCIDNISLNHIFTLDDIKDGSNKSAVDGMANTYRVIEYFEQENLSLSFDNTWVIVNNDKSKDENGKSRKNNATGGVLFVENQSVAKITFDIRSDKNKAQLSAYLDVVAHEYTHAVTGLIAFGSSGYSSDCKYFERNALAEAYSDIFGQLVEQKYTGKTDWIQSVPENNRSLKSPNRSKYTKRYTTEDKQGTDSNDYGGAHKNSTIISHTAYLMSKDNHNENYDSEFLLDYNQLGQLWYGSLFYLNDKSDFSDCRYAVEESARDLIENGVLLENNLKVIEQAFNEVEVSSNPTRRGLTDSMEIIKDKNTIVVPIEDETQSTEFVEITEAETTIETFVEDISFKSVSLGFDFSCFIDNNCNLYTCGNNYNGQLGNGDNEDSLFPIKIMSDIEYIKAIGDHSYAINKSGSLYAWGSNFGGSLGSSNVEDRNILVPTKILDNVSSVYTGNYLSFCAAITNNNELYMWGSNYDNVFPNYPEKEDILSPMKVMDNVESVSFSERNGACITTDGSLYVWGNNFDGQIGNGKFGGMGTLGKQVNDNPITVISPYKVMDNVEQISLGDNCCAAVTKDGSLYMWGNNECGQLGIGKSRSKALNTPTKIMDNVRLVKICGNFCAAITNTDELYMWGDNCYGQLGVGKFGGKDYLFDENIDLNSPQKIMDNVLSVTLNYDYVAALSTNNQLYMWGNNEKWQLGIGEEYVLSPTPIKIIDNVVSVSLSSNYASALLENGELYIWGHNYCGQFGNGTTEDEAIPQKVYFNMILE